MKKLLLPVLFTLLSTLAFSYEFSFDLSYQSSYSWRGLKINDTPVFQPSFAISQNNFSFEVWGNMDLNDDNDSEYKFNEVDYTISYDKDFENFGISLGTVFYDFPNTDEDSTYEVFVGVSFYTFLNPTVFVYKDMDIYKGTYIQMSISHTFEIFNKDFSDGLDLTISTGYSNSSFKEGYFQLGMGNGNGSGNGNGNGGGMGGGHHGNNGNLSYSSGLVDYGVRVDLPIKLKKGELNFNISYYNLADSDIHSPGFESDDTETVYGVSYSIYF